MADADRARVARAAATADLAKNFIVDVSKGVDGFLIGIYI
jgi:hypothetical protein